MLTSNELIAKIKTYNPQVNSALIQKAYIVAKEAHGSQNLVEVVRREELLLLRVEQVKAGLQTLDLVVLEPGGLVDLLEIDSGIGVGLARHAACAGGGASTWQGS